MTYCPGTSKVSYSRDWYIPDGYISATCTCCNVCFDKYIKNTRSEKKFRKQGQLSNCNCDFSKLYFVNEKDKIIERDNISVSIIENSTIIPDICLIGPYAPGNNVSVNQDINVTMSNTATFDLMTNTPYAIRIKKHYHNDNDIYYTLKLGKVGNRNIVINDGEKIYYSDDLKIEGFKTGTNDSFLFLSLSKKDIAKGHKLEGNGDSNCISITIQKHKRTRAPKISSYSHHGSPYGMPKACCDFSVPSGNASMDGTVSGGRNVNHIGTTQTSDVFSPVGDPIEFQIRLTCSMSDELKYEKNKSYFMEQLKKEIELLEKEKTERYKQVNKIHDDLNVEYHKILDIDKKITDLQEIDCQCHLTNDVMCPICDKKMGTEPKGCERHKNKAVIICGKAKRECRECRSRGLTYMSGHGGPAQVSDKIAKTTFYMSDLPLRPLINNFPDYAARTKICKCHIKIIDECQQCAWSSPQRKRWERKEYCPTHDEDSAMSKGICDECKAKFGMR